MSQFDVLIKDGMIFDGRRTPRYRADIGIKHGVIAKIGQLDAADANEVIDASGLNVAPGYIDLHTHYDSQVFWDPYCSSSGWHGVTSVVIGNCGFGFAPCRKEERQRAMLTMTRNEAVPLASMEQGMPWDWVSFPEFLDSLDRTPKAINILAFVPLNPLMVWAMGLERAKSGVLPTASEHAEMCQLLDEAMAAGAMGVSAQRTGERSSQRDYDGTPMATDLMHDETMFALAGVLARRNSGSIQYSYVDLDGILGGDMRRMDGVVRPHIEKVAAMSGRPVIVGGAGDFDPQWLKACREKGLRVFCQSDTVGLAETYLSTNLADAPNLFDLSLNWCHATVGSVEEVKEKLADKDLRAKLRADLPLLGILVGDIGDWVLIRGQTPATAKFDESPLRFVAERMNIPDLLDAFCEINIADDLKTLWGFGIKGGSNPRNIEKHRLIAADPYTIPGISDGGAHTKYSTSGNYGTRYLMTYVREHGWHSLEEAHWRLSALPASGAGFKDRGTLVEGAPADIVVYDFQKLGITPRETVHDFPANEWRVVDRSIGYHAVLVNGERTIEDDEPLNVHSGRLLRHGQATRSPALDSVVGSS
jgi:N-acyl-D-amino-acid deacylase